MEVEGKRTEQPESDRNLDGMRRRLRAHHGTLPRSNQKRRLELEPESANASVLLEGSCENLGYQLERHNLSFGKPAHVLLRAQTSVGRQTNTEDRCTKRLESQTTVHRAYW